jgi:hypothetical protein
MDALAVVSRSAPPQRSSGLPRGGAIIFPRVLSNSYVRWVTKLPCPVHKNTAQHKTEAIQDPANEFPRAPLPRLSGNSK